MKKLMTNALAAIACATLAGSSVTNAQISLTEKSFEISSAAKNGSVEDVTTTNDNLKVSFALPTFLSGKLTSGYYINRSPNWVYFGKVKSEEYTFDKDLNLVSTKPVSRPYPKVVVTKLKVEYLPLFGGLEFKKTSQKHYKNLMGLLIGDKEKVVKKVKPKQDNGEKYGLAGYLEISTDKSILALVTKNTNLFKQTPNDLVTYAVLRCDSNVNITVTDELKLQYAGNPFYSKPLYAAKTGIEEPADPIGWVIVFAPGKTLPEVTNKNAAEFVYVRISPEGKVVDKFSFNSPSSFWYVEKAYEQNGSVYLYGSAIVKDPANTYFDSFFKTSHISWGDNGLDGNTELTYTHFQVAKFTNGKCDYATAVPFADINAKQTKQGDIPTLDGYLTTATDMTVSQAGEMFVVYQDYEIKHASLRSDPWRHFQAMHLLQFDAQGAFKKDFAVEIGKDHPKVKKEVAGLWNATPLNFLYFSNDGQSINWLMKTIKDAKNIKSSYFTMASVDYCSINLASSEISARKTFGEGEKDKYYLIPSTVCSYLVGNDLYVISETKKENKILLTKIDLSK